MYCFEEYKEMSRIALDRAASFSGERGEGRLGWLWLLTSIDYDRSNMDAIYNIISNQQETEEFYHSFERTAINPEESVANAGNGEEYCYE